MEGICGARPCHSGFQAVEVENETIEMSLSGVLNILITRDDQFQILEPLPSRFLVVLNSLLRRVRNTHVTGTYISCYIEVGTPVAIFFYENTFANVSPEPVSAPGSELCNE